MKYLFSRDGLTDLRRFICPDTLMGFDYDGTLAPIRLDPDRATMSEATRTLLAKTASRFPTVVITGRMRADALRLLDSVGEIEVIGNHGFEFANSQELPPLPDITLWTALLTQGLSSVPGVSVEEKGHSLSIHYREARDRGAAKRKILRVAAELENVRLVGGKAVVNVLPESATNKGTALLSALIRARCERAIFVGDDVTDEDVFILNQPERILTVKVGRSKSSRASFYLRNQLEINDLLAMIASPLQIPLTRN